MMRSTDLLPVDIQDLEVDTIEYCIRSKRMRCMEIYELEMILMLQYDHWNTQIDPLFHHPMDICDFK